ncbi:reverse transcriptase domain-containing protein [Tanacetum coccineum]
MNKVPEKLEDLGKFLIPCALQELDRTSALANSGASINLLPHSIYKQLGLEALTPTRMTLELANRSITHPMGIAEDVVVRVDGFTFLADFVVVNFEPDPRVPIILGRPFLRTAKALIDLYEETLTLRVGKEDLVYYADKSEKNKNKHFVNAISTSDNVEKFADELAPLDSLPPGNDDSTLKKDVQEGNFQVYLNPLFEFEDNFKSSTINPLFDEMEEDVKIKNSNVSDEPVLLNTLISDKVECFAPEDNNVNTDAFLLWKFSSILGKENVHANQSSVIESLPVSPIPIEDSEPAQEEIDIFLVPDDLIPPGVENDNSEDEDNELPNLDHQDDPSIPRPPPELPDVEKCFEPGAGILIIKVFKDVSKPHDFMTVILPTLPTLVSDLIFISSFFSFRSEDTIFDPGIVTFHKPMAFSMKVPCSKIDPTISEDSRVRCCIPFHSSFSSFV